MSARPIWYNAPAAGGPPRAATICEYTMYPAHIPRHPPRRARCAALLLSLLLTACGAAAELPSASLGAATTSTAMLPSVPAATAMVDLPVVTEGEVTAEQSGVWWRLRDPSAAPLRETARPLALRNSHGLLWVQFPPFVADGRGWATGEHPTGDFTVLYAPLSADPAVAAQPLLRIPGVIATAEQPEATFQYVTGLEAVADERFLLWTYTACCGAQNGGTTRALWLEPRTGTAREILAGSSGGGRFLTTAHNDRWLFFQQAELEPAASTRSLLVDLQSGVGRELEPGIDQLITRAAWRADGTLGYETAAAMGEHSQHRLDPATGRIERLP